MRESNSLCSFACIIFHYIPACRHKIMKNGEIAHSSINFFSIQPVHNIPQETDPMQSNAVFPIGRLCVTSLYS